MQKLKMSCYSEFRRTNKNSKDILFIYRFYYSQYLDNTLNKNSLNFSQHREILEISKSNNNLLECEAITLVLDNLSHSFI